MKPRFIRAIEIWESIGEPGEFEVVVAVPQLSVVAVGAEIDIQDLGRAVVVHAWRGRLVTAELSDLVKDAAGDDAILRLRVRRV